MNENGSPHPAGAPSWILDLRKRLLPDEAGGASPAGKPADRERIVFLLPLFVDQGGLWTVLGEDIATGDGDSGTLARVSFPAAPCPAGEEPWALGAQLSTDVLGLTAGQALRIGSLPEQTVLGGLQVVPLVVAIPRPEMAGRTLSANTDGGIVLFPFQVMSLLEPHRTSRATVMLPDGPSEVEVSHIDDRLLWGPSLQVLESLVGVIAS